MKTQKEIKERINEIGKEIRNLQDAHYKNKEWQNLMKRVRKIEQEIRKESDKKINNLWDERDRLKEELEKKQNSKKIQLSKYLENWLRQYMVGIDWGYKRPFIAWHSEDERFVILTHPGHTTGTGTPMGSAGYYYASSDHTLIDTKLNSRGVPSTQHKLGYKIGDYIEGRLTKEKKQILLDRLEEYKKENNIK